MDTTSASANLRANPELMNSDLTDVVTVLKSHSMTINTMSDRLNKLESIVPGNDDVISQTIDSLTSTVKNLAYNQKMLECKLDDVLKNQTNTDVAVNDISGRLESLVNIFNNNISNIGTLLNQQQVMASGGNYQAAPAPTRGPGRPKKNQSVVTTSLPNGASYSRIQLPMNNINIPKSKRQFTNPSQESLKKVTPTPSQDEMPNPPRRRGRPPKNRKNTPAPSASATPVNPSEDKISLADNDEDSNSRPTPETEATLRKNESGSGSLRGRRGSVASSGSAAVRNTRRNSKRVRLQKHFYDEASDGSEELSQSDDDQDAEDQEKLDDEDDDDEDEQDDNDSSYEESSMKGSSRVPRLRDKGNQEEEDTGSASGSPGVSVKSRRQLELEKRRDPREKMLVSMKYSDRDKAKSFMESNKDLLKAMKEEERKKRMTAINYEPIYNNSLQQTIRQVHNTAAGIPPPLSSSTLAPLPQSSDSNRTVTADASTLSFHNSEPRRMGILSMLNSHEPAQSKPSNNKSTSKESSATAANCTTPENSSASNNNKRQSTDSDSLMITPIKRSKGSFSNPTTASTSAPSASANSYLSNYTTVTSTTTPTIDLSKNIQISVRGRPFNATNGTDNSATLLMASPIELVCKDGYFYRRNDLSTAITTGSYLALKFKNKEEELIKMTMHEDYAELTRQNRINAYFMKPDIDVETEYACQVLSRVTLTERYVNSLEYFLMEFRWENRLVSLGLRLRESKRTWQRRKALFALFEFWRDKSREKRGFTNFTIFHAVKEMENYRVFINRSVSWFYNHITLLKMILFDLCDNTDIHWREWMFPKGSEIPVEGLDDKISKTNINQLIDSMLTLDFLEDGTENLHTKSSAA
ncbi:HBR331Cp [Eremothecium sinecaudum]|uniref:HBR331Cp n=1 Tax=Eremothecium sinecaudum TaxID=45286 RepID=A0A120K1C6_9SACH|nr:HBR331Cp [Eremothecium sinecaudum]AMD19232.1 HBR331Cp [Eremothecium sinecaudum]